VIVTGEEAVGYPTDSRGAQEVASVPLPSVGEGKPNPLDKAIAMLTNAEIVSKVEDGSLPQYKLETELNDHTRAVEIRRQVLGMCFLYLLAILFFYLLAILFFYLLAILFFYLLAILFFSLSSFFLSFSLFFESCQLAISHYSILREDCRAGYFIKRIAL
jgi:hypothetical protein